MSKSIINQRFISCVDYLIKTKRVPSKSFLAEIFNISTSKFSEILKERMNVGVDILMILTTEFDINSEWLLTGQGSMLKQDAQASSSCPQQNDKYIQSLEKQISLLEKNNALQEKEIHRLETHNQHLTHRLSVLEAATHPDLIKNIAG